MSKLIPVIPCYLDHLVACVLLWFSVYTIFKFFMRLLFQGQGARGGRGIYCSNHSPNGKFLLSISKLSKCVVFVFNYISFS